MLPLPGSVFDEHPDPAELWIARVGDDPACLHTAGEVLHDRPADPFTGQHNGIVNLMNLG